ncbi:hypothetical protein FO519_005810 [Halicephalobus sp. NKZ332]|nr:hypothetical protein FO519_005810 [Halicephalobus sp. NKZ332]
MPRFFCMPFFACNRQVDCIDKRQCNLTNIPNEIERYSRSLEELLLDMNHIKELPKSLFRLHRLQKLGISDNDVYKIPSDIAHLQNLMELNMSRNDISDIPDELRSCKNLRILDISSNPIARLPDSISQVTSLTHLNLNDTSLTKLPQDLGNLQNLKSLEVRENHLHSLPSSMALLVNLQRLDVGQNELDELPNEIYALRSLQELYIDENHLEELPEGILNCKNMEQLDISSNKLIKLPEGLGELERLTDLILSQNCLQYLPNSIRLLKRLQIMKMDNNNLTSLTPAIGSCSSLVEIYLMHNLLQELPSTLSNLRRLEVLNVDKNNLTSVPSLIGNCDNLTVLSLRDNQLKELPLEVGKLVKLRVLDVCGNQLRYLPFTINVLFNLQALWISENQSQAMLKFTQIQDPVSNMRVLTCYLLPQQGNQGEVAKPNSNKAFVGGPKVHFGTEGDSTMDDEAQVGASNNFERHDTPHPKPHQGGKVKKGSIDGHVIPHESNQNHPTNIALTRKISEDRPSENPQSGPRSALKHPNPHYPFSESASSDNLAAQARTFGFQPGPPQQILQLQQPPTASMRRNVAFQMPNGGVSTVEDGGECKLKRINTPHYKSIRSGAGLNQPDSGIHNPLEFVLGMPQVLLPTAPLSVVGENFRPGSLNTSTTISTPVQRTSPTTPQGPPPSESTDHEVKRIVIRRSASTGLGLSIAGGIESTPFIDKDTGLFVSKLTPGGAAEQSGLRVGDKLIEVNGTSMVNQRHDVAVQCMQKPVDSVVMVIERVSPIPDPPVQVKTLSQEMRSGASPNTSFTGDSHKDVISTTVSKDAHGSPGFSLTQTDKEVVISALKPGGSAERENRIQVGDVVITVNGNSTSSMALEQISRLITNTPGDVYLVIQRAAKINGNYINNNMPKGIAALPYGDTSVDNKVDTVELMRDENNSLGLSIVGGIDHCSHPFGVNNPGVFISKIAANSPAANSGLLRIGDRILSVNKEVVEKARHNDAVTALKNSGKKLVLKVKHEPQPKALREVVFRRRKNEAIGLSICGGISSPAANPNDSTDEGIFIEKVEKGSSADECGFLKPGVRILEINEDSLLGCTQVEAANLFRQADSIIRLLICEGFSGDPVLKPQASPSPGVPLNFSEPPLAASSPIPVVPAVPTVSYSVAAPVHGTGYRNGTSPNASSSNASTSFSTGGPNTNSSTRVSNTNSSTRVSNVNSSTRSSNTNTSGSTNVTLNASSSQIPSTTFSTSKPAPPPVAPKPKPKVIPVTIEKSPTSPQNPPEHLTFNSKLKRFESEISSQSKNGFDENQKSTSLPSKKPLLSDNDIMKIQEDNLRKNIPDTVTSPMSPEVSMESALNTSLTGPQVVRTKKAENRLAAVSSPANDPLNTVEQHELDIRKRHEWRQARLASLDAETQRADQIMKQLTAKRLGHISEERSTSTSPSRVLHNESSVENFATVENGNKKVSVVETSITQREFDLPSNLLSNEIKFMDD